jgi:hypothetical protein
MRLLYTPDNWIAFMINVNVIYQNIIIANGCHIIEGIKEANSKLGTVLSREFKRMIGGGIDFKTKDLLTILDQLSRFHLPNTSFIREIESKLLG